ncbi:MAG: hypothetical protein PHP45_07830 [Elusimicrobiales bacterium]|nr:hypothetical protein [Elusimicrobiales bacterium]
MPVWKRYRSEIFTALILSAVIIAVWCWVYGRTTSAAWRTPLDYSGDAIFVTAQAKAYLDGDILPVGWKFVKHLGAPFTANWNDYPVTESLLFAGMGWLGRVIGLFAGVNVFALLAFLLAGISFWAAGTILKYRPPFVLAGAVLFAFSHFISVRMPGHIVLAYCWHIPLLLLVTWRVTGDKPALSGAKWRLALALSFIAGTLNPYYTFLYLQLLGFAALRHILCGQKRNALVPVWLGAAAAAGFLLMNFGPISYAFLHGKNAATVTRTLSQLNGCGLRAPELFTPSDCHRWPAIGKFQAHHTESWSPYLGFAGIAGFLWLAAASVRLLRRGKMRLAPVFSWQALWILLFAHAGGINMLLGLCRIFLFRCANRYSIALLAISLLFLIRQLSRRCPPRFAWPAALAIVIIGLWDQLPPLRTSADSAKAQQIVSSDRDFTQKLEAALPPGGMVFQLPVADYPEIQPINRMTDYEHFRPYLYSRQLRFSYGSSKGRLREAWQHEVERLPPAQLAAKLEEYGFSAIYINRNGYQDAGQQLLSDLKAAGKQVLAENGDMVAVRLVAAAQPVLPKVIQ